MDTSVNTCINPPPMIPHPILPKPVVKARAKHALIGRQLIKVRDRKETFLAPRAGAVSEPTCSEYPPAFHRDLTYL